MGWLVGVVIRRWVWLVGVGGILVGGMYGSGGGCGWQEAGVASGWKWVIRRWVFSRRQVG